MRRISPCGQSLIQSDTQAFLWRLSGHILEDIAGLYALIDARHCFTDRTGVEVLFGLEVDQVVRYRCPPDCTALEPDATSIPLDWRCVFPNGHTTTILRPSLADIDVTAQVTALLEYLVTHPTDTAADTLTSALRRFGWGHQVKLASVIAQ